MRRLSVLVVLGMILTFKLEARKIEGKILFKNDTLNVIFNIPIKFFTQQPNYEKLQNKVKYFDSNGKKIVIRPENAKEIQFKFQNENIRMLSRLNSLGLGSIFYTGSNIFLRLEIDGDLKLFHYYYTQRSAGMYNGATGGFTGGYSYTVDNYLLQKGNAELKRPHGLTFKKDMAEYFSECPIIVEKIESKVFRKKDLESIVRFYNEYCK